MANRDDGVSSNNGQACRSFVTVNRTHNILHRVGDEESSFLNNEAFRSYHATSKQQILPLLVIGVGVTGFYTYRALKELDAEWEDYYEKLEEYRAATGLDPEADAIVKASSGESKSVEGDLFTGGTLAIDLGTSHIKLAHLPSLQKSKNPQPKISIDREGRRSTPSLAWIGDDDDVLVGRLAEARRYDNKGGKTIRPRDALSGNSNSLVEKAVRQSIRAAASDSLQQVLGGEDAQSSTSPLFVLDESMAFSGSYNVCPVFTYPPPPASGNDDNASNMLLESYKTLLRNLTSPEGISVFVPEPLAAVAGAEYYNLLPAPVGNNKSVLVVDVGGATTNVSIVSDGEVIYSSSMPIGGDTFIDCLAAHLIKDFYGSESINTNESDSVPSMKPKLDDPTALQRLHEASTTSLYELSNKSRSQINIPFLSIDLQTKQPKHLDVGVARSIIDTKVESFIRDKLTCYLLETSSTALSKNLPRPTDLSTLFSSTLASAMEFTSSTPFSFRAVLVVGGGARIPLVKDAMKTGVRNLAGDAFLERLIMPDGEMGEELVVLGAALCGGSGGM